MEAYRVHFTMLNDLPFAEGATIEALSMHVAARTREEAVYKVFDELSDQGHAELIECFGEVYIQHEARWIPVPERSKCSAT